MSRAWRRFAWRAIMPDGGGLVAGPFEHAVDAGEWRAEHGGDRVLTLVAVGPVTPAELADAQWAWLEGVREREQNPGAA